MSSVLTSHKVRRSVDYDTTIVTPLHRILKNYFPDLLPISLGLVISNVDVISETICITNTSSTSLHLQGFTLRDQEDKHVFRFPDDFMLHSQAVVAVYCTPGKMEGSEKLIEPYLLWTNADGSLRRKEVLNNDEETVTLYDSMDSVVCRVQLSSGAIVFRSSDQIASLHHKTLLTSLTLSYLRIVLLLACSYMWYMKQHVLGVVIAYVFAALFDICVRLIMKMQQSEDVVITQLLLLSDRVSAVVMYTILMQQNAESSSAWTYLWQLCLILDISLHWFQHANSDNSTIHAASIDFPFSSVIHGDLLSSLADIGTEFSLLALIMCSPNCFVLVGEDGSAYLLLMIMILCFAGRQLRSFLTLMTAISSMAMPAIKDQKAVV